jgi:hypothetical protein
MPEKAETTHVLMPNELIVYRRDRSGIWQCRFKVADLWQRASTKQRDLKKAKEVARELMIEAEIRKRANLPVVTRRLRDIAKLPIERMDNEMNRPGYRGDLLVKVPRTPNLGVATRRARDSYDDSRDRLHTGLASESKRAGCFYKMRLFGIIIH